MNLPDRFLDAFYADPILRRVRSFGAWNELSWILSTLPDPRRPTQYAGLIRNQLRRWGIPCTPKETRTAIEAAVHYQQEVFHWELLSDLLHTPYDTMLRQTLHRIGPGYAASEPYLFEIFREVWPGISLSGLRSGLQARSREIQRSVDQSLKSYVIPPVSLYSVLRMSGGQFTRFVLGAHQLQGWQGWITRESGDQGGDIYLIDPWGTTHIDQAKRWKKHVEAEAYYQVFAAWDTYKTDRAAIVTSSYPTASVRRSCQPKGIVILDRPWCQRWIALYDRSSQGLLAWNRAYNWFTPRPVPAIRIIEEMQWE